MQKTVQQIGKYEISDDEKSQLGENLAEEIVWFKEDKEQMKEHHKEEKETMKARETVLFEKAENIVTGYKSGNFTCIVEFEFSEQTKHYRDVESAKIIFSEPMTEEEAKSNQLTMRLHKMPTKEK